VKNNPFRSATAVRRHAYSVATKSLVETFGSYEKIAQEIYKETGEQLAGNTVGRWFRDQNTPTQVVVALAIMTEDNDVIRTMCPFLAPFLKVVHEENADA